MTKRMAENQRARIGLNSDSSEHFVRFAGWLSCGAVGSMLGEHQMHSEVLKPFDRAAQCFWARAGFRPLRGWAAFGHSMVRHQALLGALRTVAGGRLKGQALLNAAGLFSTTASRYEAVWVAWL